MIIGRIEEETVDAELIQIKKNEILGVTLGTYDRRVSNDDNYK